MIDITPSKYFTNHNKLTIKSIILMNFSSQKLAVWVENKFEFFLICRSFV